MSPLDVAKKSTPWAAPSLLALVLALPYIPGGCASTDQDLQEERAILAKIQEASKGGVSDLERPALEALARELNLVAARLEQKVDDNADLFKDGAKEAEPWLPAPVSGAARPLGELVAFGYLLLRGNKVKGEAKKAREIAEGILGQSPK